MNVRLFPAMISPAIFLSLHAQLYNINNKTGLQCLTALRIKNILWQLLQLLLNSEKKTSLYVTLTIHRTVESS